MLFDPGLQPERTELAWRRTALAIAVGSLVSMRVLPVMLGSVLWVLVGIIGLAASALLWVAARARYRAVYRAVHPVEDTSALPDGRLLAAMAVFACGAGLVAVAAVTVVAVG